jgi:oligoribonuclease NrnB/cAMP/cGMP phosphodiesterase (DHH superfamily)
MERFIVYHNDADGRCAAAIAGRDGDDNGYDPVYFAIDYGQPVPPFGLPKDDDQLWIVDFSFPKGIMLTLADLFSPDRMWWFDHHRTAIDSLCDDPVLKNLPGVRLDGLASCAAVWWYCRDQIALLPPVAVDLIADRDVWAFTYGDLARHFYECYRAEKDTSPASPIWDRWFKMDRPILESYVEAHLGRYLYETRIGGLKVFANRLGYEDSVIIESGKPPAKVLRVNYPASGDMGALINNDMGYAVAWLYTEYREKDGVLRRRNNLYSKDIDVSEFCRWHGGGGHRGAAGFVEVIND